jgi:hypothetical protein
MFPREGLSFLHEGRKNGQESGYLLPTVRSLSVLARKLTRMRERAASCFGKHGTSHPFSVPLIQEVLGNVAPIVGKLL